jgi:hypothetical protein
LVKIFTLGLFLRLIIRVSSYSYYSARKECGAYEGLTFLAGKGILVG